jgi:hypothetical protein
VGGGGSGGAGGAGAGGHGRKVKNAEVTEAELIAELVRAVAAGEWEKARRLVLELIADAR